MAEVIQDIYQLSFDGGQFEKELANAIAAVEQYEATLNDATASTEDLAAAQEGLVGANKDLDKVLSTQAKSIDDLDAKQSALTKQQDSLNKSSSTYGKVAQANVKTQSTQAKVVASTTKNNKSLGKSLLSNVRNLNRVRSAGRAVNQVFRAIAGVSVFGLVAQILPTVINLFSNFISKSNEAKASTERLVASEQAIVSEYVKETQELNNLFGALNEANQGRGDKKTIIDEINKQYGEYLPNIDLEKAGQEELQIAYEAVAKSIAKGIIERRKTAIAAESQERQLNLLLQRSRLEDDLANAQEKVRIETEKLGTAEGKRAASVGKTGFAQKDLNGELENARRIQRAVEQSIKDLDKEIETTGRDLERLDEVSGELAETLSKNLDVSTLTGDLEKSGKSAGSATTKVEALSTSLAGLQKELSRLEKLQREQTNATDAEALASRQRLIDAQKERIAAAQQLLADLRGQADAEANIERLKTEAFESETQKRIRLLQERAQKEIEALVGTEPQKIEQQELIEERLVKAVAKVREDAFNKTLAQAEAEAQKFKQLQEQGAADDEARVVANEQKKLAIRLQALEKQRIEETNAANFSNEQIIEINKGFDAQRVELEKETQRQILQIQIEAQIRRIEALKKGGESFIEAEEQLEQLRLQLIELDKTEADVSVDAETEGAKNKIKELIQELAPLVQELSNSIFDVISQQAQALTQRLDSAVQRSQSALENIRQNSEDFNADQLEIEKKRLEDLEEVRARAARREQVIAQIQVATNAVVAIARSAAEGGIAAPFTIAATIASLIAGFAAARNASTAAFYDGTEYLERSGAPIGRDTIHIRAHEGERIVPTRNNLKYYDAYSAMQNERIPSDVANVFANGYLSGGLHGALRSLQGAKAVSVGREISLSERVGLTNYFVQQAVDFSGLEKRLSSVEDAINRLPQQMPVANFRADKKGFTTYIEKYSAKMKSRSNRAK